MKEKKSGKSESIYYKQDEVAQLASEAEKLDISPKELIKSKSLSKDGTVKVVHKVNFGKEMNQAMIEVARGFHEIGCFFHSLDSANDELRVHPKIIENGEHLDLAFNVFVDSINEMKEKYLKEANAG